MKKTVNKWDISTPFQRKIAKYIKVTMAIIFLSVWTPIFVYTIAQVIQMIIK